MKRPQVGTGFVVTTPMAATMIKLLGLGVTSGGIAFTRDETEALNRLYGFTPEQPNERPPRPERKPDPEGATSYDRQRADEDHKRAVQAWERWEDPQPLMQAGANRNLVRHAEADGLRLVAWLAKHVPAGTDPLKTLVQMAALAGWDVAPEDNDWAEQEDEEERTARRRRRRA